MPRGSSRQFRTKYSGAANLLGLGGTANRLTDSGFVAESRGALESQGFAVSGRNVSRIFQANADLAEAELGLGAFTAQTMSIDFDTGEGAEHLDSAAALVGIAGTFTIAGWAKANNVAAVSGTLFGLKEEVGNENTIQVYHRHAGPTGPLAIQWFQADSGQATRVNSSWQGITVAGAWMHVVIQWNGIHAQRKLWFNGVDQGASDFDAGGSDGTLTDTARRISFAAPLGGLGQLLGRGASLAIWNSFLGVLEIPAIYNAGDLAFNLQEDSGNYASAANLQHWFQIGKKVAPDIGEDTVGSFDLITNASNIDDNDRVADVPT